MAGWVAARCLSHSRFRGWAFRICSIGHWSAWLAAVVGEVVAARSRVASGIAGAMIEITHDEHPGFELVADGQVGGGLE